MKFLNILLKRAAFVLLALLPASFGPSVYAVNSTKIDVCAKKIATGLNRAWGSVESGQVDEFLTLKNVGIGAAAIGVPYLLYKLRNPIKKACGFTAKAVKGTAKGVGAVASGVGAVGNGVGSACKGVASVGSGAASGVSKANSKFSNLSLPSKCAWGAGVPVLLGRQLLQPRENPFKGGIASGAKKTAKSCAEGLKKTYSKVSNRCFYAKSAIENTKSYTFFGAIRSAIGGSLSFVRRILPRGTYPALASAYAGYCVGKYIEGLNTIDAIEKKYFSTGSEGNGLQKVCQMVPTYSNAGDILERKTSCEDAIKGLVGNKHFKDIKISSQVDGDKIDGVQTLVYEALLEVEKDLDILSQYTNAKQVFVNVLFDGQNDKGWYRYHRDRMQEGHMQDPCSEFIKKLNTNATSAGYDILKNNLKTALDNQMHCVYSTAIDRPGSKLSALVPRLFGPNYRAASNLYLKLFELRVRLRVIHELIGELCKSSYVRTKRFEADNARIRHQYKHIVEDEGPSGVVAP